MNISEPHRQQRRRHPTTMTRYAALIATMGAIIGGLQLTTPRPAMAVSGVHRTVSLVTPANANPTKSAIAECPYGQHVIGGGASVYDGGRKLVRLTALWPVSSSNGSSKDTFFVGAEAPNLRQDFNSSVTAYAMCADVSSLTGYRIVPGSVASLNAFQTAAARCPTGTVAFGAGASVYGEGATGFASGQVGLQLNRTSGPLDISRASARTSAFGYGGRWTLNSYAICAQPRGQIHAESTLGDAGAADDTCKSGVTHGPGGGGGLTDGGPAWLQTIYPSLDAKTVHVSLTGPLYPSIGGTVAHQTCAM